MKEMKRLYIHFKSLDVPQIDLPKALNSSPSLPEAKAMLESLVNSLGTYESDGDKSRVIAVLITPMMVAEGALLLHECPPVKVSGPHGSRERLIGVLNALYGEDCATLGCKIL
jgi:hypothetical protein